MGGVRLPGSIEKPEALLPNLFGEGSALRFVGEVNLRLPRSLSRRAAVRRAPARPELRPGRRATGGRTKATWKGVFVTRATRAFPSRLQPICWRWKV